MSRSLLQLSVVPLQVAMMRVQLATRALRCERFAHVRFVPLRRFDEQMRGT
jgi:hypothetical protein